MKKIFFLLFLLPAEYLFSQTPAFISDSLDNYINQGMRDWQIPGLALVIVKDGKIVQMKGYGVKDILTAAPVTENTLFMIASNTKLFTATSLAQLDYDKKISLDDRFSKYFPDYSLYEPTTTALLTIRDLLSHRIGTSTFQGDFTFWNSRLSRSEIMDKMKLMKPAGIFRQDFGYCNSCYLSAGQIIPKVTGRQWEVYVRDSILDALQMNSTYTSIDSVPAKQTLAKPYSTGYTGTLKEVPYDHWDNLAPAASIISNVSDLSHWLLFQLDSGRFSGKQIMPFDVIQKTRQINTMVSSQRSGRLPTHITGYGLGVFVADYNGYQIYYHSGGAAGMVSIVCFVPEKNLGIAILTNNDDQNFYNALRLQILDAYLGVEYHNRSKAYLTGAVAETKDQLKTIADWKNRVKNRATPLPLKNYAGHYTNPLYGSLDITVKENHLAVRYNSHENLTARMDYMDQDEWLLEYDNVEYGVFSIKFKTAGTVLSFENKQNDFVEYGTYTFTKQ